MNAQLKRVRQLHSSTGRKEQGLFIVEGLRAISTVLSAGFEIEAFFCTQEMFGTAQSIMPAKKIVVIEEALMKKISTATTPSGLLAVFKIPTAHAFEDIGPGLVLAQIADPGNMGTLIRTAAACGVTTVVVIEGVDPWSPKVVQSSAGTIALVNFFCIEWQTLMQIKKSLRLYALVVSGGETIKSIAKDRALIVVGNEARGIPDQWLKDCDSLITLPMPGRTESLNAAIAGSIALYLTFCNNMQ